MTCNQPGREAHSASQPWGCNRHRSPRAENYRRNHDRCIDSTSATVARVIEPW